MTKVGASIFIKDNVMAQSNTKSIRLVVETLVIEFDQ